MTLTPRSDPYGPYPSFAPYDPPAPHEALDRLAAARILFLNWRDPAHPQAGGAEVYCDEIARRWAAAGADLTFFCARHPGAPARTVRDGMRVVRAGDAFGVYPAAVAHILRNRNAYDAVVDFQNGIPFFSPLFVPGGVSAVCVVHHVHRDQFRLRFRPPLDAVGRVLEKQVSRAVYRGRPVVAVSPSTREGLRRRLGFHNPVHIVPNGSPPLPETARRRDTEPVIAVVSRLTPHKRIDLLLRALPELLAAHPGLRVDVAGDGPELPRLRELAARTGTSEAVTFHGRVSDERRTELLAGARLTVVPSVAEGWGLTVIEANAVGTPALAFAVPGLRDAVQHGRNGWLLPSGDEATGDEAMGDGTADALAHTLARGAAAALDELADPAARERTAARCRAWTRAFSWDDSAERLARVVLQDLRWRRGHLRTRRHPSDLTVVGRFQAGEDQAEAMEAAVRTSLRQTDGWARTENSFRLVLHDCDEKRALEALDRIGVPRPALALASRRDLLVGPGRAGP